MKLNSDYVVERSGRGTGKVNTSNIIRLLLRKERMEEEMQEMSTVIFSYRVTTLPIPPHNLTHLLGARYSIDVVVLLTLALMFLLSLFVFDAVRYSSCGTALLVTIAV